jgi:uncharacterized protein (TIGR03437 family)
VTGTTSTSAFPLKNPLYSQPGGAFVTKLNATGSALLYSTYLAAFSGNAIALDTAGNGYVAGYTKTAAFPLKDPVQATFTQGAPFVTALTSDGAALIYSTFLGNTSDSANAIAIDSQGNAYIAGSAGSSDLPGYPAGFQTKIKGTANAFVVALASATAQPTSTVNAASFAGGASVAPNSIAAVFGSHLAIQTLAASGSLGTSLGGTAVTVKDSSSASAPAQLFFVSPGQVNFLLPAGLATGPAQVQITAGDGVVSVSSVTIANVGPGIFTSDGKLAVGQAQHVDAQGNQTFQDLVQYNSQSGQFTASPINLGLQGASTYLILYGTGIRNVLNGQSTITIGGQTVTPAYAGIQGTFAGLDQVNLQIPNSLAGAGDVSITFNSAGIASNTVHVAIQ